MWKYFVKTILYCNVRNISELKKATYVKNCQLSSLKLSNFRTAETPLSKLLDWANSETNETKKGTFRNHSPFIYANEMNSKSEGFLKYDISSFRISLAVELFYINYIIIHEKALEIECFWSYPFWFLNLPNLAILEVSRSSTENSRPNLNWLSLKLPFLVSEFAQLCNFESLQELPLKIAGHSFAVF